MLNTLRENSKSLVMTIFFGAIIAVFIFNFGPGSGSASCTNLSSDIYAAKVAGRSITKEELREAQMIAGGPFQGLPGTHSSMQQVSLFSLYGFADAAQNDPSLNMIISREILANAAEQAGFAVTDDQIDIEILQPSLPGRSRFANKEGKYDNDAFEAYVSLTLNVSIKEYRESIRRYLLAQKMADFLFSQVKVSDDEILFQYKQDETRVELEFIKFFTSKYVDQATVSDDEAKTYADANKDAVQKYYDEHQDIYGEQVRARHILRKVNDETSDDAAKAEIERLHKLVTKEGADFGQFAAENSQDGSASKGGDLGWAPPTNYVKEFKDACIALKPGEISEPIKTQFGYHIIKMEEKKQAKPLDEVKIEIAKELAKESKTKELAKADAEKYVELAKALAATGSLEKILPVVAPAPAPTSAPTSVPVSPTSAPTSAPTSEPIAPPAPVDPFALKVLTATFNMTQAGFGNIDPLGSSKEIALAAFSLTKENPQIEKAYEVGDAFVVARLKSRTDADVEKFKTPEGKTEFDELRENALNAKQGQFLAQWLISERKKLESSGEIKVYAVKAKTPLEP
jgi:parvulin-like peptidyl-prolyl isomerase